MVKRGVDILVSVLLLCFSSPVMALSALIIRISSPGPVLFRQERMGRGFKPFQILKLRTMAHADAGLAYTLGPDPRITAFGRFLRRSKIDELPQLWNVLRGDMSLVGPRPVLPALTAEFRIHYMLLLRGRPGLTDPASLKYSQEARLLATAADPMRFFKTVVTPDKIEISLEYMEHANLWTDLVTLAMTCVICCVPWMSRVYGRLPRPEIGARLQTGKLFSAVNPTPRALDQSLFSHAIAQLEASEESGTSKPDIPWNHLHIPKIKRQSSTRSANRSAS